MIVRIDSVNHVAAIDGSLDCAEAQITKHMILRFCPGSDVVIDCHGVHETQDSALATLVAGLQRAARRVDLRGLEEEQQRRLELVGD
jgi:anti-anti-sigma regulatory factor